MISSFSFTIHHSLFTMLCPFSVFHEQQLMANGKRTENGKWKKANIQQEAI